MSRVHCATCLHEEQWAGEERQITVKGGRRQPSPNAQLAAWRAVRGSLDGSSGPVVGPCPECEQPMVADSDTVGRAPWELVLPNETLVATDAVTTASGTVVSLGEVDRRMHAAYRERMEARTLVKGAMIGTMVAPLMLWMTTFFVVFWILYNILRGGVGLVN